jgi:flagellar protein FliJ
MKQFRYRLQTILKLKEQKEKQLQKEHALALQQVLNQERQLEAIEGTKVKTFEEGRKFLSGTVNPQVLMSTSRYLVKLKRDTVLGKELLRGLENEAERRRVRLVEASRVRKSYEKHREKLERRFVESIDQKESKLLDEMAIIRYTYNKPKRNPNENAG